MIDPEDYPVTANRGYRHPPDDVGGVGVANDVPGDLTRLAEDVDVDVQAVADAAAASVQTSRTINAGSGLSGGGDLSADRTLSIAAGGVTSGMIAAGAVGDAAISGGVAAGKIAGTALVASTVDAKGDLLAATGADTVGRLPVGADGEVLVADSGEASGIGWKSLAEADVARASQVGNLLPEGMANSEDGTTVWRSVGGSVVIANDNTYARTGTRSQKITTNQNSALVAPVAGVALADRYEVVPGEHYTFAVWVRPEAADENWIGRLYWYNSSNVEASTARTDSAVRTLAVGGWTLVSVSGRVPSDAAVCVPVVVRSTGTAVTSLWLDDASFHRGIGGRPSEPGLPTVGTQATDQVVVTKDGVTNKLSAAQPVAINNGTSVSYTLPPISDNSGVKFTLVNNGTGTVSVYCTGLETIAGLGSVTIPGKGELEIISTGSSWNVLSGRYSTNTVGLATYEWDHASNAWRLIAYDTGWRDVGTSLDYSGMTNAPTLNLFRIRRGLDRVSFVYSANTTGSPSGTATYALPAGFQPYAIDPRYVLLDTSSNAFIASATTIALTTLTFRHVDISTRASWSWEANRAALPSSLPGTQVTAPA